jgi:hypothetical protein
VAGHLLPSPDLALLGGFAAPPPIDGTDPRIQHSRAMALGSLSLHTRSDQAVCSPPVGIVQDRGPRRSADPMNKFIVGGLLVRCQVFRADTQPHGGLIHDCGAWPPLNPDVWLEG